MAIDDVLLDIAPETNDVTAAKRSRVISYAEAQVDFGQGTVYELAVAYLAAHILTISGRSGTSGPVASKNEGDLSISYAATSNLEGLKSTSYGMEYLRMVRQFNIFPRTRLKREPVSWV